MIALDFPGFGGSAKLPAHTLPNAAALADAVEREMDQLGTGDFHVAGYSLGGRVCLDLATRGRIRSVVAIAPDGQPEARLAAGAGCPRRPAWVI